MFVEVAHTVANLTVSFEYSRPCGLKDVDYRQVLWLWIQDVTVEVLPLPEGVLFVEYGSAAVRFNLSDSPQAIQGMLMHSLKQERVLVTDVLVAWERSAYGWPSWVFTFFTPWPAPPLGPLQG